MTVIYLIAYLIVAFLALGVACAFGVSVIIFLMYRDTKPPPEKPKHRLKL